MSHFFGTLVMLGQEEASQSDANAVFGILLIIGIVAFICWLTKPKHKGYTIDHKGKTEIKPR